MAHGGLSCPHPPAHTEALLVGSAASAVTCHVSREKRCGLELPFRAPRPQEREERVLTVLVLEFHSRNCTRGRASASRGPSRLLMWFPGQRQNS